jgi:hypothetical protein
MVRRLVLIAVVLCLRFQVALAEGDYPSEAGYGVLAVATNLLYMPAKFVYAALGGLTGSLAYLLTVGDLDTAESIWSPSLGGTYVVSPKMLRSEEPILFSGASHSKD